MAVGPLVAVEGLGQDARGGGLADAARPGEQVGMGDAVAFQGVDQGLGHRFLADEVGELLRPIAAGQDGVFRRRPLGRSSIEETMISASPCPSIHSPRR